MYLRCIVFHIHGLGFSFRIHRKFNILRHRILFRRQYFVEGIGFSSNQIFAGDLMAHSFYGNPVIDLITIFIEHGQLRIAQFLLTGDVCFTYKDVNGIGVIESQMFSVVIF